MKIFINDEEKVIDCGLTLSGLLSFINLSEKKGIALAVNGSVVPKMKWDETILNENDKILIISATRGG